LKALPMQLAGTGVVVSIPTMAGEGDA
jgi:hypothetical protein